MARGTARAPSQNAYRGAIGKTTQSVVHVTGPDGELIAASVFTTIDAVSDPDLVERLYSEDPGRALNALRTDAGATIRIPVPVVYHDPAAPIMVLVLGDAHRHREIDERIALLDRLRDDHEAIPAYAKDFAVVFGPAALRSYLEQRAEAALDSARVAEAVRDIERRKADLVSREAEMDRRGREQERRHFELDAARSEVERHRSDVERSRGEVEQLRAAARARVIATVTRNENDVKTVIAPSPLDHDRPDAQAGAVDERQELSEPEIRTAPLVKSDESELLTATPTPRAGNVNGKANGAHKDEPSSEIQIEFAEDDDDSTGSSIIPQGSDPLTTETEELPLPDDTAAPGVTTGVRVDGGVVRLSIVANEQVARGLGGVVDVRVLLLRTDHYPVVALLLGPPSALRVPSPSQLVAITLDAGADGSDRDALVSLAASFDLVVDVIARGNRIRRFKITAPLAENVDYILRAVEEHLRVVAMSGQPSYERAVEEVLHDGYDLLGTDHVEASEFRDDKLAQLETAQQLRRAIAMARRFVRPAREDYLVCTRGFPLARWHQLRRHVLDSAVTWGMWMGPELAQIAVSEGLARSRRDLVVRLDQGFEALRRHPDAFDIDNDAAEDNLKALADEAHALGVDLPRPGAYASDDTSVVSGSIGVGQQPTSRPPKQVLPTEELIAQLDDRNKRVNAALELCERGEAAAATPVIQAVTKMNRTEAVRILGMSVRFGEAALEPLLAGMSSSKAFLRHGCALALALLRTDQGTQAVIQLLFDEPTEIWREVARAIGQVGPLALMPLASNYGRLGDRATSAITERVAWAMAHVGVRGGQTAIETMAHGQSVVAPVAARALELLSSAANDHVRVRPNASGSQPGRDVTVNRAFSRRFFEALEQGVPEAGTAALADLDVSGPMEMLDESDLIEAGDAIEDEAELDESDLIQT